MGPGMKQRAAGTGRSLSNFLVALAAAWILNENASFSKQVHGQQGIDRIADLDDQRSGSNCTTSLAVFAKSKEEAALPRFELMAACSVS